MNEVKSSYSVEFQRHVETVHGSPEREQGGRLRFGAVEIDLVGRQVLVDGRGIAMRPREFRLLAFLATHPNRVFTREKLLRCVWDLDVCVDSRTVDVHVWRIRSRLDAPPHHLRYIETVRQSGYRFNPSPAPRRNQSATAGTTLSQEQEGPDNRLAPLLSSSNTLPLEDL